MTTDLTRVPRPPWYEIPHHMRSKEQKLKAVKARRQMAWEALGRPGKVPDTLKARAALKKWREGKLKDEGEARALAAIFLPATGGRREHVEVYDELLHGELRYDVPLETRLTPVERKSFWRRIFGREEAPSEDHYHYRVRSAWRISREMARLQGLVGESALMASSIPPASDAWSLGMRYIPTGGDLDHDQLYGSLTAWVRGKNRMTMSLAPPGLPLDLLDDDGLARGTYDPEEDQPLARWIWAVGEIVDMLQINLPPAGDRHADPPIAPDPDAGRFGLTGFLDPVLCRLAWPSTEDIERFETELVDRAMEFIVDKGPGVTGKWLQAAFGLSVRESLSVLKMARTRSLAYNYDDPEEARALLAMRLERMYDKAVAALDLELGLKILKQLTLVRGLGKIEPETRGDAMRRMVDKISTARRTPQALQE